jgi:hypothetical protein
MKRLALTAALLGLAFAASAQTAAPAGNCLKHTGSRLIRADNKGRKCAIATGRAYNRDDIDRTGAVDLRDAIRRLDPAVH